MDTILSTTSYQEILKRFACIQRVLEEVIAQVSNMLKKKTAIIRVMPGDYGSRLNNSGRPMTLKLSYKALTSVTNGHQ